MKTDYNQSESTKATIWIVMNFNIFFIIKKSIIKIQIENITKTIYNQLK